MSDEMLTLARMARLQEINTDPAKDSRAALEQKYGQVWNTDELSQDFEVLGFGAPFVVVKRRSDGKKGSLEFAHSPRHYFNFKEA